MCSVSYEDEEAAGAQAALFGLLRYDEKESP